MHQFYLLARHIKCHREALRHALSVAFMIQRLSLGTPSAEDVLPIFLDVHSCTMEAVTDAAKEIVARYGRSNISAVLPQRARPRYYFDPATNTYVPHYRRSAEEDADGLAQQQQQQQQVRGARLVEPRCVQTPRTHDGGHKALCPPSLAMLPLKLTIHDRSLAINYDGTTGIVYGSTTVLRYLRGLGW